MNTTTTKPTIRFSQPNSQPNPNNPTINLPQYSSEIKTVHHLNSTQVKQTHQSVSSSTHPVQINNQQINNFLHPYPSQQYPVF